MSLVHQVLRNIDDREDQDIVIVPEALQLEKKSSANWWLVSLVVVSVLIMALAFWFWRGETVLNPPKAESGSVVTATAEVKDTVEAAVASVEPETPLVTDNKLPLKTETTDALQGSQTGSVEFNESQVTPAAVKVVEEPVVASKQRAIPIKRPAAREGSHLLISQRDQQSHQQYTYMLTLMRQKQWTKAGGIAEDLLQSDGLDPSLRQKLLHNKLRILLEEKQFDQFLSFYNQHQGTDSIGWLSTAAPGLHMMAAYPEAAASYQRLIDKQPTVVNWPIALALVLEQQGQQQQAQNLFSDILASYSLQDGQRRWVENKLEGLR